MFIRIISSSWLLLAVSCSLSWDRSDAAPDIAGDEAEIIGDLSEISCPDGVSPQPEQCNGRDDDCDGEIDEDFACPWGQLVQCRTTCGSWGQGVCAGNCEIPAPENCITPAETCNGADDDCDGNPDNGYLCVMSSTQACSTTCGSGTQTCLEGTCTWGSCSGTAGDCNTGETQDCTPFLECGSGSRTCDANCHWGECSQETTPEICDTDIPPHDNNCDTIIDEGVKIKLSEDIRVTITAAPSDYPFMVWTGSQFFIAWNEGAYNIDLPSSQRQVYAALLSSDGTKIGTDIQITSTAGDHFLAIPVLATTEVGIFWADYRNLTSYAIYMARMGLSGVKIGDDILLVGSTGNAVYAGPVWSGLNYGVAWQDTRSDPSQDIFFQLFQATGVLYSGEVNVTSSAGLKEEMPLRPLWTGTEFITVYSAFNSSGEPHCQMARFSSSGDMNGSPVNVLEESSLVCIPAWIDSTHPSFTGFAMTWMTALSPRDSALRYALFDPTGGLVAGPITVHNPSTNSMYPITTWNEDQRSVGISWVEQDWTAPGECWFAEVNMNPLDPLAVVTGPMQVSDSGGSVSTICSNAWTGSAYGLAWQDMRHNPGASEVYFALVGCP